MARPYWSGQIRISLISFGVQMFPATEAKSEIHFRREDKSVREVHREERASQRRSR